MTKPHLSQRAIVAYNRLSLEVAALNYLTRVAKPAGTLGLEGRIALDRTLKLAFRLYRREPGLPFSGRIDTSAPLTNADLVLLVARLTTCCTAFEERYAHLKADGGGVSLSSKAMPIGST